MNGTASAAVGLVGTLFLAACGNAAMAPIAQSWKVIAGSDGEAAYNPVEARSLPYATMEAFIGDAPAGMMVLGQVEGGNLHWIAADRNAVVTRSGRIIATAGLPSNLLKTLFVGGDALEMATPSRGQRQVDLSYRSSYGVLVTCDWARIGPQTIDIRGITVDTVLWEEYCRAPVIDWTFTNQFWRDGAGFVWKSVQHYVPDAPPMTTAVLKPYQP